MVKSGVRLRWCWPYEEPGPGKLPQPFLTGGRLFLRVFGLIRKFRPGFKILIESKHFIPGLLIDENIENAIKKSNSAIKLVSQRFVNSPWCRKEFELCKLENMKDTSFSIFVIMMKPENELENVNIGMTRFFQTTIFLKKDDPDLLSKLSFHLAELRQIHGNPQ